MPVHSVVPVQDIGGALTLLVASVAPTCVGERTPVWKPRVTAIAGHHLEDVVVGGPARGRRKSHGQSNGDREKGLVHDRLDLRIGCAKHRSTQPDQGSAGRALLPGPAPFCGSMPRGHEVFEKVPRGISVTMLTPEQRPVAARLAPKARWRRRT
jgi:hypothetical protein